MTPSRACFDLVVKWEGFSAHPYRCPADVWTIGYGHTRGVTKDTPPVSLAVAENVLRADLAEVGKDVEVAVPALLSQPQFDALVSFAFNVGSGALMRSRLRTCCIRGDMKAAAAEFDRWVYAGGNVLPGLVRRRAAERALFESGIIAPKKTGWWKRILGPFGK